MAEVQVKLKVVTQGKSSLNCGCGARFASEEEAEKHVSATGHAVTVTYNGVMRPNV